MALQSDHNFVITDTLTDLNSTRTGLTSALLIRSSSIINTPTVIDYKVFLDISNGTRVSVDVILHNRWFTVNCSPVNQADSFIVHETSISKLFCFLSKNQSLIDPL